MKFRQQPVFWVGATIVLFVFLYSLWSVALPFLAALVIAYLLNPLVERLHKLGMGRLAATLFIVACFIVVLAFLLLLGIPAIAHQIAALVARLPDDMARLQAFVNEYMGPFLDRLGSSDLLPQVQKYMGDIVGQTVSWLAKFLPSLVSGGQAIVSFVSLVIITPVVVFYLLLDWRLLVGWINTHLPVNYRDTVWTLGREISVAIDGFLRGQLLVCICLGCMYAFGLWLIGLNSGITIGLIAGMISFIPYVGSLTGLVLAVGVAVAQFWPEWTMIVATFAVFMVGQFIEGNILSPKLVGASIGVHPVWLMFALFVFGSLFGFGGLLIAAPMAGVLSVLARFAMQQYRNSVFYLGEDASKAIEAHENGSDV